LSFTTINPGDPVLLSHLEEIRLGLKERIDHINTNAAFTTHPGLTNGANAFLNPAWWDAPFAENLPAFFGGNAGSSATPIPGFHWKIVGGRHELKCTSRSAVTSMMAGLVRNAGTPTTGSRFGGLTWYRDPNILFNPQDRGCARCGAAFRSGGNTALPSDGPFDIRMRVQFSGFPPIDWLYGGLGPLAVTIGVRGVTSAPRISPGTGNAILLRTAHHQNGPFPPAQRFRSTGSWLDKSYAVTAAGFSAINVTTFYVRIASATGDGFTIYVGTDPTFATWSTTRTFGPFGSVSAGAWYVISVGFHIDSDRSVGPGGFGPAADPLNYSAWVDQWNEFDPVGRWWWCHRWPNLLASRTIPPNTPPDTDFPDTAQFQTEIGGLAWEHVCQTDSLSRFAYMAGAFPEPPGGDEPSSFNEGLWLDNAPKKAVGDAVLAQTLNRYRYAVESLSRHFAAVHADVPPADLGKEYGAMRLIQYNNRDLFPGASDADRLRWWNGPGTGAADFADWMPQFYQKAVLYQQIVALQMHLENLTHMHDGSAIGYSDHSAGWVYK
jgi:hypothetical protein